MSTFINDAYCGANRNTDLTDSYNNIPVARYNADELCEYIAESFQNKTFDYTIDSIIDACSFWGNQPIRMKRVIFKFDFITLTVHLFPISADDCAGASLDGCGFDVSFYITLHQIYLNFGWKDRFDSKLNSVLRKYISYDVICRSGELYLLSDVQSLNSSR